MLSWNALGYEIFQNVRASDFSLSNQVVSLRHNVKQTYTHTLQENDNLRSVLKDLEERGKKDGNAHISGFCCIAERTKIGSQTVKDFVNENHSRLLRLFAQYILSTTDEDMQIENCSPFFPQRRPLAVLNGSRVDVPDRIEPCIWPLIITKPWPERLPDDFVNFLMLAQNIATTLGVSHQEHMYQHCIKMALTSKGIAHMSPFHCMVKLGTGDMAKIGECDILLELHSGHYLVELKVCSQCKKYEDQIKKYINGCYSIGRRISGACILNFHPKGQVECFMYQVNTRHLPQPKS